MDLKANAQRPRTKTRIAHGRHVTSNLGNSLQKSWAGLQFPSKLPPSLTMIAWRHLRKSLSKPPQEPSFDRNSIFWSSCPQLSECEFVMNLHVITLPLWGNVRLWKISCLRSAQDLNHRPSLYGISSCCSFCTLLSGHLSFLNSFCSR